MGWDKGSLTEQQTKGTVTTTIWIRKTDNTNSRTHRAALTACCHACSQAATAFPPPRSPPTGTQHGGMWYWIPCSVWPDWVSLPGCVPSWLLVKINPVLVEPRTDPKLTPVEFLNRLYSLWFRSIIVQRFLCQCVPAAWRCDSRHLTAERFASLYANIWGWLWEFSIIWLLSI